MCHNGILFYVTFSINEKEKPPLRSSVYIEKVIQIKMREIVMKKNGLMIRAYYTQKKLFLIINLNIRKKYGLCHGG